MPRAPESAPWDAVFSEYEGVVARPAVYEATSPQGASRVHVLGYVLTDVDLRIDPTRPNQKRRDEPLAERWGAPEAARDGPAQPPDRASAGHGHRVQHLTAMVWSG